MTRRRLIFFATIGVLLLMILLVGLVGMGMLQNRIASSLAQPPVSLEYSRLSVRLRPLAVELSDVSVRLPATEQGTWSSIFPRTPELVTARSLTATTSLKDAIRLLRSGPSVAALRRALQRISLKRVHVGTVGIDSITIFQLAPGRRLNILLDNAVADLPEGLRPTESRPRNPIPEQSENDPSPNATPTTPPTTAPIAGKSLAEIAERFLKEASSLRDRLPALRMELTAGRLTWNDGSASLAGTLHSTPSDNLRARFEFQDTPIHLITNLLATNMNERITANVSGELEIVVEDRQRATLSGAVETPNLTVRSSRIAPEPIGPVALGYDFAADLNTAAPFTQAELARPVPGTDVPPPIGAGAPEDDQLRGTFRVTEGELSVGRVNARFRPVLQGLSAARGEMAVPTPARIDFELELPETPLQAIVDAFPPAVLGPLQGLHLGGTFSWEIRLEAPLRRLSWTRWQETNRLEQFAIEDVDPAYDVRLLAGAFRHRITNAETGYRRVVTVPPSNDGRPSVRGAWASIPVLGTTPQDAHPDPSYRYSHYDEISPAFIGAVVTAEDGEFFRHNGVNWLALTFAMEVNLAQRGIVIGGSTIPMQLAKNVFLDNSRVLVRKLQELGLVALSNLSSAVSRKRVLEIYLNVIEFGPNVYGINDATQHYFDRTPAEMSVPQAVWLASIIRNPRELSRDALSEEVPPWRLERMANMMEIMVERDRLSEEELREARGVQPRFKMGDH